MAGSAEADLFALGGYWVFSGAKRFEGDRERAVAERPEDGVRDGHKLVDERKVGDTITQRFEHNNGLESGERRSRTDMRARSEGQMITGSCPVHSELPRMLVPSLVAVGGGQPEDNPVTLMQREPVDIGIGQHGTGEHLDRRIVAQRLLDEHRTQRRVGADLGVPDLALRTVDNDDVMDDFHGFLR
jgi:hypothetical protein